MTGSAKETTVLLGAGLLLGALANQLLRTAPWGINLLIWTAAFCGVITLLVWRFGFRISRSVARLTPLVLFFAATFAWRDSDTLKVINGTALGFVIALAALRSRSGSLALGWVNEYSFGLMAEWLTAPISYIRETATTFGWWRRTEHKMTGTSMAALRGVLIALPLLFVFGALFVNADASFEQFIQALFSFDLEALLQWIAWLPLCTLIAGGILLRVMQDCERADLVPERGKARLGVVETGIVLGMLNLLFLCFIATQFNYFFGGSASATGAHGLSVAEYARRGFFELVAVTLLVLPLLLTFHWLQEDVSVKQGQLFRSLSGSLVVMLFAIMASAMHRMYLYQKTYGLTELRLYTSVFMIWLAIVFIWFLNTVLFDQRWRFAFGALMAGFAIIAMLDFINPDGLIVQVNTKRSLAGKELDCGYLFSLSNDAVPALIDALPLAKPHLRRFYSQRLLSRLNEKQTSDWRCWNWSSDNARQAAGERRVELLRLGR